MKGGIHIAANWPCHGSKLVWLRNLKCIIMAILQAHRDYKWYICIYDGTAQSVSNAMFWDEFQLTNKNPKAINWPSDYSTVMVPHWIKRISLRKLKINRQFKKNHTIIIYTRFLTWISKFLSISLSSPVLLSSTQTGSKSPKSQTESFPQCCYVSSF